MILPPPEQPALFRLIVEAAELVIILGALKWWNDRKRKKSEQKS